MLPPWPDILAKYNLLVSQTHTLSSTLSASFSQTSQNPALALPGLRPKPQTNPFEKLALHPTITLPEAQFDNELIPLLRSQQTTQVLNLESSLVSRIQESVKDFNAANGVSRFAQTSSGQPNHEQTLQACEVIRTAHDARVDRARRAVTMLRDKYDWRARVEITFPVTPPPEAVQSTIDSGMDNVPHDQEYVDSPDIANGSSDAGDVDNEVDDEESESAADNMVIDITDSAVATPANQGEDNEDENTLSGIFTPSHEDNPSFPP